MHLNLSIKITRIFKEDNNMSSSVTYDDKIIKIINL